MALLRSCSFAVSTLKSTQYPKVPASAVDVACWTGSLLKQPHKTRQEASFQGLVGVLGVDLLAIHAIRVSMLSSFPHRANKSETYPVPFSYKPRAPSVIFSLWSGENLWPVFLEMKSKAVLPHVVSAPLRAQLRLAERGKEMERTDPCLRSPASGRRAGRQRAGQLHQQWSSGHRSSCPGRPWPS
ncbi:hypothetical protein FH972_026243 [Carpinus fangiana]|uniref:Uncharacterized protein n=1 Tax=Carpinus fangiana TaxID=176857 RepID=A0A5N6L4E1_9ROSI|nr:hypothetical protein FH972_026243 [Carpinus fangiana]